MKVSRSKSAIALTVFALTCPILGFISNSEANENVNYNTLRAYEIIITFTLAAIFYAFYKRHASLSKLSLSLIIIMIYGAVVSFGNDRLIEPISYIFRILTFILVFEISRNQSQQNNEKWSSQTYLMLTIMLGLYAVEILFQHLSGQVKFFNNAYRFDASINSAIGLATTLSVLMMGLLYIWLKTGNTRALLLSLLALALIFLTATRSISVLSALLLWLAFILKQKLSAKIITLGLSPIAIIGIIAALPKDLGLIERFQDALSVGSTDTSSTFRQLIIDIYFQNITYTELFFGIGLGSFPSWFQAHSGISGVAPHFEWLWITAEFGLLIFLLYMAAVLYATIHIVIRNRTKRELVFLGVCVITGHQTIFQLANPLYFYQAYIPFAILLGIYLTNAHLRNEV